MVGFSWPIQDNGRTRLPTLDKRAVERAEYLCERDQWSHEGYEHSFDGLEYRFIGENLAKDFATYQEAYQAWQGSPAHNANLTSPQFQWWGFGAGPCGIWVELYAGD